MKYLRFLKIVSVIVFLGALALNLYNNLNSVEKNYSNYIFWLSVFMYFISRIGIDILIKRKIN